jgi:hypothetical protein
MATVLQNLNATRGAVELLRADFSELEKVNDIITKVLKRLQAKDNVSQQWYGVQNGTISLQQFDGWFAPLVRQELGKTLGIVRNKAVARARAAGAKDAATAILRRTYKDSFGGNVNILGNRKRISFKHRTYPTPQGGVSGIMRKRSVSDRTMQLYQYYGPDRSFILRFLENGTDIRTAKTSGPTGNRSQATWGNRGSIGARNFFGPVSTDMDAAAKALGTTLVNYVEDWIEQVFNETK